jgi:hypothetical protein
MKLIIFSLLLIATCSCSAVTSRHPVGSKPSPIEKEKWEGKWLCRDGEVTIKAVAPERGLISVFWVDSKEKAQKTVKVEIYESEGWLFANTNDWSDEPQPEYVWARVRNQDKQITIWAPDLKKFKSLVSTGVLPGTMRGNDVILGDLKPSHLKLIMSGRRGLLFDWDDPLALVKVSN